MLDAQAALELLRDHGPWAALVILAVAIRQRWIITGSHYDDLHKSWEERMRDMEEDRDYWRDMAVRGTVLAERGMQRGP